MTEMTCRAYRGGFLDHLMKENGPRRPELSTRISFLHFSDLLKDQVGRTTRAREGGKPQKTTKLWTPDGALGALWRPNGLCEASLVPIRCAEAIC